MGRHCRPFFFQNFVSQLKQPAILLQKFSRNLKQPAIILFTPPQLGTTLSSLFSKQSVVPNCFSIIEVVIADLLFFFYLFTLYPHKKTHTPLNQQQIDTKLIPPSTPPQPPLTPVSPKTTTYTRTTVHNLFNFC